MERMDELIPKQQKGGKTDSGHEVHFDTEAEAKKYFNIAKLRLQDVNRWHDLAGILTAEFRLTDESGREVDRLARTGDYFKISIPAPGPGAGDGYDWVRVELIEDNTAYTPETETFGIRVRPADNPKKNEDTIAHFFKDDATSSFIVERKGTTLKAAVHGRNELPNTTADKPLDKARNAVVGIGAIAGFSTPQWKSLVKGILNF